MTYPRIFFAIVTLAYGLAFTLLMHLICTGTWGAAQSTAVLLGIAGIASVARVSNPLAHAFADYFGKGMCIAPVRAMVAALCGRTIARVEMIEAPEGRRELRYENVSYDNVSKQIREHNGLETLRIDLADFQDYVSAARYTQYYPQYVVGLKEYIVHKQVQHYLSTVITPIKGHEVWMDVASCDSPFPDILTRLYGITVFRQDLSYPPGAHGLYIGSNADCIPVPAESIDRISLHCSFEHFEGDSDSGLVRELGRVLARGGVACIIPLYLSDVYQIMTNPRYWLYEGVPHEEGVQLTVSGSYWTTHGRFYDWTALRRRVLAPLDAAGLGYRFIQVIVPPAVDYPQFVVLRVDKP